MSPEAVVARIETYASPGGGWWVDSRAIRTSPDEESRSSQAGSPSATPTVSVPEAVRSSTGALVAVTVMSPEPELARTGWCARLMVTSPDPDLATTGHCASPTVMSPEPAAPPSADGPGPGGDLGPADVGAHRHVGQPRLDHVLEAWRYAEPQVGVGVAEGPRREADPQPVALLPDLYGIQVLLLPGVDRALDELRLHPRLHGDGAVAQVVQHDMAYALVRGVAEGHRTQPWTRPGRRGRSPGP